MTDGHVDAAVVSDADRGRHHRKGRFLGLIPGFVYILLLFILGQMFFSDPRAILFHVGRYQLAWVEVLLVAAAIMAMAEQIKVAIPGVNNTTEVLLMGLIAIIQVVLFSLAAAKVPLLHVYGDAYTVVPWDENTKVVAERYQKLGGRITLICKPGGDHHPHGLSDPTPIVDFIFTNTATGVVTNMG